MTLVFFGMATADGGVVSEAEWNGFVAEVLTPRFPDGLTVLSGAGQYQPSGGGPLVREQAKIVLLVHDGSVAAHRRIEEAAAEYRQRFGQEAVLRATTDIRVAP